MAREQRTVTARLDLPRSVLTVGECLGYSIINEGTVPLMYGLDCALEWHHEDRWITLPFGGWFAAVGKQVEPGLQSDAETCELTQHLGPGRYRLVKRLVSVDVLPSSDSIECRAEFAVSLLADADE